LLRNIVPALAEDRYFHPDMAAATDLVTSGGLARAASLALPGVA
jgi:histidine ammonia-lyase